MSGPHPPETPIQQMRHKLNMSQKRAAEAIGIHRVQLSRIETGDTTMPYPGTLERIAVAYGVSVEEVIEALS